MVTSVVEPDHEELETELTETQGKEQERQEEEIPEKFRGKSVSEIVESYRNLESEFGRKSNEVGELRRLTDELLGLQLNETQKKVEESSKKKITGDDLYEHPDETLDDYISQNPKIRDLEKKLQQSEISRKQAIFESQHSDWQGVVQSSDFQDWITASPIRQRMLVEADRNYDFETASELLTLYKEIKKRNQKEEEEKSHQRKEEAKRSATTETGSAVGGTSKKIFRRSELINLRVRDPDKYASMEDEIMLAYKEGRVK